MRTIRVGAAVAAMIMLSACQEELPPVATAAPASTSAPVTSTTTGQDLRTGKLAEGARMADALTPGSEIDPVFVRSGQLGILTDAMLTIMTGHNTAVSAAATANGLITGFVASRFTEAAAIADTEWLTHGVMRFPDAASATAAADDLATAATTQRGMLQTDDWVVTDLPTAPDSRVVTMENRNRLEAMAFTPHREYVVFTKVRKGGLAEVEKIVRTALEHQLPQLDSFKATRVADLAAVPYDATGIHDVAVGEGGASRGAFGRLGAAHYADDQQAARAALDKAGVSEVGVEGAIVYRTVDAAGAASLLADQTAEYGSDPGWKAAPAAPDAPGSACWAETDDRSWLCLVTAGRYAAQVPAKSQAEAHTLTAEQHRVLTAAK
ncbi:DUF7373 family lipoprotein [Nocardia coubleae]|uniref:Lipoprotein n=1 Tax=Nocardia coubleae TaxID=356147 RepID=A0A846VY17_9NOCA|nr:hypothetical protein [Nocardia coubleae]NKX85702.1 hypothetical protein [Nocardia coubleae]